MEIFLMLLARIMGMVNVDDLMRRGLSALGQGVKGEARHRMNAAVPDIAAAMVEQGWTVAEKGARETVRDALYRCWRAALRHVGPLIDAFRDTQAEHVFSAVGPRLTPETTPAELVQMVADAAISITFAGD